MTLIIIIYFHKDFLYPDPSTKKTILQAYLKQQKTIRMIVV